jgi:hypothetical protein
VLRIPSGGGGDEGGEAIAIDVSHVMAGDAMNDMESQMLFRRDGEVLK